MAMSAQELFDSRVPRTLAGDPSKAKEIGAVYLFKITGERGGEWTLDLASPAPSCKPGNPDQRTADCTIEIAHEDFEAMIGKPALAMQFYFQGKMKVSGDTMLATKLQKLLAMGG
jgi:alkyl sulfatase BDS1-like metallo-beta-lactamase superfamily hydrolase